ncbi:hypothetical protein [Timonella senegalensis]|uniref:hypothetical protein n=1 Tax=Timonella senegalensis TaxID=1465825 RepID=UPI0002F76E53|nr:hypothetical protein [Timonella senegalensis]
MTLTGNITGASRQELINQATQAATAYYGNACFSIRLHKETSETDCSDSYTNLDAPNEKLPTTTIYTAEYTATPMHTCITTTANQDQPRTCRDCGQNTN